MENKKTGMKTLVFAIGIIAVAISLFAFIMFRDNIYSKPSIQQNDEEVVTPNIPTIESPIEMNESNDIKTPFDVIPSWIWLSWLGFIFIMFIWPQIRD